MAAMQPGTDGKIEARGGENNSYPAEAQAEDVDADEGDEEDVEIQEMKAKFN